jgi:hypothetical protein
MFGCRVAPYLRAGAWVLKFIAFYVEIATFDAGNAFISTPSVLPQPYGDFRPKILYLSGEVATAHLSPHFAPVVRKSSANTLRL